MVTIQISKAIGNDIRTRIFFRRDIERLVNPTDEVCLDFSGVVFVTRSVADEMYNVSLDFPRVSIINLEGEVKKMYDVVERGRENPRVFEETNFKTVKLESIHDAIRFFESEM